MVTVASDVEIRTDWPQLVSLAVLTVVLISIAAGQDLPALTVDQAAAAAPGAMLAIVVAASIHTRLIDVSYVGLYAVVIVVVGQGAQVSDTRVLLALALAVVLSLGAGVLASLSPIPVVYSLLMLVTFDGLASAVSSARASISDTSSSMILRAVGSSSVLQLGMLVAVAFVTWLLLVHSNTGRSLRVGPWNMVGSTWETRLEFGISRIVLAALVWFAAIVAFSRLGVSSASDTGQHLVGVLSAVFVGTGRSFTQRPTPVRVAAAYVLLVGIHDQLLAAGWSSGASDVAIVAPALIVLVLDSTRDWEVLRWT